MSKKYLYILKEHNLETKEHITVPMVLTYLGISNVDREYWVIFQDHTNCIRIYTKEEFLKMINGGYQKHPDVTLYLYLLDDSNNKELALIE